MKRREFAFLALLMCAALFVHGYHPYAEDAEIYVPSIAKILNPSLFPFGQEFFEANGHLTIFPRLMAEFVRISHASLDWVLFCVYIGSIFLLLLACFRLASKCFSTAAGRWGAVTMVACLLTLPVAGTSLYIFDQYLNPRCISAFAVLFAIDAIIERRYWRAVCWLIVTAAIHPFMTVFAVAFIALWLIRNRESLGIPVLSTASVAVTLGFHLKPPSAIYWRCLENHRYYFLLRWTWYEWLGILGPLAILWCCGKFAERRGNSVLARLSQTLFLFEAICFAVGLIVTIPHPLEILAPYQPMRILQLVYLLMFMIIGGLVGEYVLKKRPLLWIMLFVPIATGLCVAQLELFPQTRHVEWPGAKPINPWLQAFAWIHENTPTDAVFALDPNYMVLPEENYQGFRAAAKRSSLADAKKDWSAAVLYPWLPLADEVFAQTQAVSTWKRFGPDDFERLREKYDVTWVVVQQPAGDGLDCPFQNNAVRVCRIEYSRK